VTTAHWLLWFLVLIPRHDPHCYAAGRLGGRVWWADHRVVDVYYDRRVWCDRAARAETVYERSR
jgi:hypothetical protein